MKDTQIGRQESEVVHVMLKLIFPSVMDTLLPNHIHMDENFIS